MRLNNTSLFSQLLKQVPRNKFNQLVRKHQAEKASKGFTCWTQFVSMMFCHLGRADSLRVICFGLASCLGKLSHLGLKEAPKKSTLSYANRHRPSDLYKELFFTMLADFRSRQLIGAKKKSRFRFKNKLMSMDATTISMCLSLFPWADFRRSKAGVKLHILLDHEDYMPSWAHITSARQHERTVAQLPKFNRGSIIAFDMAYNDYALFGQWCEEGIFFVTRMKSNARYRVVKENIVPKYRNIISDELIELISKRGRLECPHILRRVVVWDEENQREIVLLSNHLKFGATTIGAIYKDRWQIEIFFKTIKQHLKIKTFIGTNEQALLTQIWTALIALLLLKWLHFKSLCHWSLSNLVDMLRLNLSTSRDLDEWLYDPGGWPQYRSRVADLTPDLFVLDSQLNRN